MRPGRETFEALVEAAGFKIGRKIQEQGDEDEDEPLAKQIGKSGWDKLIDSLEEVESFTKKAKEAWRAKEYLEILAQMSDALESISKIAEAGTKLTGREGARQKAMGASYEFDSLRRMLKEDTGTTSPVISEATDISKHVEKIAKMTDQNEHCEAVTYLAEKVVGDKKLTEMSKAIEVLHHGLGEMPPGLGQIRDMVRNRLIEMAREKYPEYADAIYKAF
jgi:hypothetical protein